MKHLTYQFKAEPGTRQDHVFLWKKIGVDLLIKHDPPHGQRVLDLGCGRGETMKLCQQAGYAPVGADIDPVCLDLSKPFGEVHLIRPAEFYSQFADDEFDDVLCFHVLEHEENPKRYLQNMRRIAKRFLVLAVPNLRQLTRLFCRRIDLSKTNEGHLQSWDHWHFLNLCERHCGLKLVEWAHDATVLPGNFILDTLVGQKATVKLEKGIFRKMFPFHGISVIGIFSVDK